MLSHILKYSGVACKTRAMSRSTLTMSDYDELIEKTTVEQVGAYLMANTAYKDVLSVAGDIGRREMLEKKLRLSISNNINKLIRFKGGNTKKFLKIFSTYFDADYKKDIDYYKHIWKIKGKLLDREDNVLIVNTIGAEIDLMNVLGIVRCKMYYDMSAQSVHEFLIPIHHKLSRVEIDRMIEAPSIDQVLSVLQNTRYKNVFALDRYAPLDHQFHKYIYGINHKNFRDNLFSIVGLLGYMTIKEYEIHNIFFIIESIRYGKSRDWIKNYIII